ncbi:MAG: PHP domain-containing protein, partial [Firmicutes bacterium]|nr:PHP domain-containing protein [Bacillota bacterium]
MADYVELHAHSAFSFLDSASLPEELVLQARDLGYRALALTDHDGLYGSMEFAHSAKAWGLQPITGAELTLGSGVLGAAAPPGKTPDGGFHLTFLAETPEGYANLCRLISLAYQSREKGDPSLAPALLAQHAEGLICLSGCRHGEIARLLDEGRTTEAEAVVRRLQEWFGPDRFYIELQQTLTRGDTQRIRALTALARQLGLPLVATGNVHYHRRERYHLQDTLVAIRHRTTLEGSHAQRRGNSEFYLHPPEEMAALFRELPEAVGNTRAIAERCQAFDLTRDLGYRFPDFAGSDREGSDDDGPGLGNAGPRETAGEALERVSRELLAERYRDAPPDLQDRAWGRLEEELRLIRHHGLSGFLLGYGDL